MITFLRQRKEEEGIHIQPFHQEKNFPHTHSKVNADTIRRLKEKKKKKKSSNNAEGGIPSKYNHERDELSTLVLKMDCHCERKLADHRTEARIRLLSIHLCDQDKSVQIPLCYITTRWS